MHALVLAPRRAQQLAGAIGEHLVGVHVVRGAGAGLIHVDHELIAQLAVEHLGGGALDRLGDIRRQTVQRAIGGGRGFLDEDGRRDELGWRGESGNGEVLDRARRLDAVVGRGRHAHLAERIAFDAVLPRGHMLIIGVSGLGAQDSGLDNARGNFS